MSTPDDMNSTPPEQTPDQAAGQVPPPPAQEAPAPEAPAPAAEAPVGQVPPPPPVGQVPPPPPAQEAPVPSQPVGQVPPPPPVGQVPPPLAGPAPVPAAAPMVAVYPDGKPMFDASGRPASPKSRLAAAILAWFLGFLGIHRFYVGKVGTGILMIVTLGGLGIWVLVDFIMILIGSFKDKQDRVLSNW
jgi:hypothetical protein